MDVTTQPPQSSPPDPQAALKATAPNAAGVVLPNGLREQITGQLGRVYDQQAALANRTSTAMQTGAKELEALHAQPRPPMPNLMDVPPPPKPLPMQELTDQMPFYTLMAVLGGMATRQPLLNATKAMGAAIKGWHEGDMQGFSQHLQQWDADSKFAIQKNQQLMASRKAIMEDREASIQDKEAALELLMKQYGIEDKGLGAQGKNLESMLKTLDHHEEMTQRLQDSHDRMSQALEFQNERLKIDREKLDLMKEKSQGTLGGLPEDVQDFWAGVMATGTPLPPYLGRSTGGPVQQIAINVARSGIKPEEYAANRASMAASLAGARTAGQRSAGLGLVSEEAKLLAPLALQASEKFDRTSFPMVNRAIKSYEENTGDENVRRFGAAVQSFVNVYSNIMTRGNVTTDSARDHAMELLRMTDSPQAFKGTLEQLMMEIDAAEKAPDAVLNHMRDLLISGKLPGEVARQHADGAAENAPGKKVVRTGTHNGRKVVQYDDGTTEYAD